MKTLFFALIFIFIIYLFFSIILFFFQDKFIFFPDKYIYATPEDINLDYQDVYLTTEDNTKIHGWYIPHENSEFAMIFFHGNAGNISHRLETLEIMHQLGLTVLIIDYRGYGKSKGKISEEGLYLDGLAAWDYLCKLKDFDECKIILHGRSLGGGVATQLALEKNPAALILESAFTSIPEMGKDVYPIFPVKLLAKFQFNSKKKISEINCPKLLIHSKDDEIIPFKHGKELFKAAIEPKQFFELSGGHNEGFWINRKIYMETVRDFILGL